jgi:hypothetical protein
MARRPKKISEESAPVQVEVVENAAQSHEKAALQVVEEKTEEQEGLLLPEERSELKDLERQIQASFFTAAKALLTINKKRLYRETHSTFELYCQERFDFTPRHTYHQIKAAEIIGNLQESERPVQLLPVSEYQIRPLSRLKTPTSQAEAWRKSVDKAGGKPPTHKLVKETVNEFVNEEELFPEPTPPMFAEGAICVIKRGGDSHLRDRVGFWARVSETTEGSYTIELYDRTVKNVDPVNIRDCNFTTKESEDKARLLKQLRTLYNSQTEPEEVMALNLEYFAKLTRPILTKLEKSILKVLERQAQTGPSTPPEIDDDREVRENEKEMANAVS